MAEADEMRLALVVIVLGASAAAWLVYERWVFESKRIDLVIPEARK